MSPVPQPPRRQAGGPPGRGGAPRRPLPPGAVESQPVAVRRRWLPQFTKLSTIELAVAVVLFLLSAYLGWAALRGYFVSSNLSAGLFHYGSNQPEKALTELQTAAAWAPDDPVPLLILAKIKVDAGSLDEAEGLYGRLLKQTLADAETRAGASVGLGVIRLKRAEGQSGPALKATLAAAKRAFEDAAKMDGSLAEASIGLAHTALIGGDPAGALVKLGQVGASSGSKITLDGLLDLYIGTGAALRRTKAPIDNTLTAFRQAVALAPSWRIGQINLALLEAEQMATLKVSAKQALEREGELRDRMKILGDTIYSDAGLAGPIRHAMIQFYLGYAWCLDRGGPPSERGDAYTTRAVFMTEEAGRIDKDGDFRLPMIQGLIWLRQARRKDLGQNQLESYRTSAVDKFLQAAKVGSCPAEYRALALNNVAVLQELLHQREKALKSIGDAAKAAPGEPAVLRNQAILNAVAGNAAEARGALEGYLKQKPDDASAQALLQRLEGTAPPEEEEKEKSPPR